MSKMPNATKTSKPVTVKGYPSREEVEEAGEAMQADINKCRPGFTQGSASKTKVPTARDEAD